MRSLRQILVSPIAICLVSSFVTGTVLQLSSPSLKATAASGQECITSFDIWAYHGPILPRGGIILPLPPWQLEGALPPHQIEGYYDFYFDFQIAFSRSINGRQEYWITGTIYPEKLLGNSKSLILVYQPESQIWEFISSEVEDTGSQVESLFLDRQGGVWGRTIWKNVPVNGEGKMISVLSKLDESTHRFVVAQGVLEIPIVRQKVENGITFTEYDQTIVLLDKHDKFWIFAHGNGLYLYDPATQTTERRLDLTNRSVGSPILAPDGTIYFSTGDGSTHKSMRELFTLTDGMVAQFIPETNQMILVDTPDDGWPTYSGLFFDDRSRLWLGATGYRELDGSWHLIHPDPQAFFDIVESGSYSYIWGMPSIILQSSDGILWYKRFLDTSGWVDGTAWYDPATGEGCVITNVASNIIEDSQHQLWLVADGKLYKNPLKTP